MLQAVSVDSTAGGTTLFAGGRAQLILIRNTGAADAYLKFDETPNTGGTILTTSNGALLKAGEQLQIIPFQGVNSSPFWPVPIRAICGTSTTISVQVAQF